MIAAEKKRPARKLETRLRSVVAKVVQIQPDCEVCGRRMEEKFLKPFPGAPNKRACQHCIQECTGEVDREESRSTLRLNTTSIT